jgi:hypothetical protein
MLREVPQGPIFDAVSNLVVLISDLQKGLFSAYLFYVLRKASRFLCAGAPVFGITQKGFGSHAPASSVVSSCREQENRSAMCLSEKICRALQKSHKLLPPQFAKISQIAPAPVVWGRVCQWPK